MLIAQILNEADVFDPTNELNKWIHELSQDLEETNPDVNHDKFLNGLRDDILNNKKIFGPEMALEVLLPYKPKQTDPTYIRNKTDVYVLNPKALKAMQEDLFDFFIPEDEGMGGPGSGAFAKFHELAKNTDMLDPDVRNKIVPIKKAYETGQYDFQGIKKALTVMSGLGHQKWKYDKSERQRLESEAPIVLKFEDYFWVRLDSPEEFQREAAMMQNCLGDYCPVGQSSEYEAETLGYYDKWLEAGKPGAPESGTVEGHYDLLDYLYAEGREGGGFAVIKDWVARATANEGYDEQDLWDEMNDTLNIGMRTQQDGSVDPLAPIDAGPWGDHGMIDYIANKIVKTHFGFEADQEPEDEDDMEKLIYSLRDENGYSHVAAEYDPRMDMNHVEALEVLGRQNTSPKQEHYWYVQALDEFFQNNPETFGVEGITIDEPLHPQYDHPGDAIESHPPYDAETNRINMPVNVESINTINNNIIRIKKLAGIV